MITRNLKNLTAMLLQSTTNTFGSLMVRGINGRSYYTNGAFSFPVSRAEAFTFDAGAAGVSFGTGSTPANENDLNLESTITSGVTVTLTSRVAGCDAPGNPWLQYTFTITNATEEPLTIREIGYKQTLRCATSPGRTNSTDVVCLLDRTVLDAPLILAAGDAGVLVYKLKTNPMPTTVIGGVEIVSFEWGSNAQIAAMIDAAHAGTIDLQRDAGWRVGNMRKIHIDAFTGGGNTAHAAQDIDIVITSFENYNNCGCVLQFDFAEALAEGQRINASDTNAGGYGATEMKTVTLPALVEALPTWLKDRLLTFNVLASAGNASGVIETVTNNQLALRSEIEVFGASLSSYAGEGSQIEYYELSGTRAKGIGYSGSNDLWWERSPKSGSSSGFCSVNGLGARAYYPASCTYGCAPFGCI